MIRIGWRVVGKSLPTAAVALGGLLGAGPIAGCSDSNKSDGQITPAPEARKAAEAIGKSYAENMLKQHAVKKK